MNCRCTSCSSFEIPQGFTRSSVLRESLDAKMELLLMQCNVVLFLERCAKVGFARGLYSRLCVCVVCVCLYTLIISMYVVCVYARL